MSRAIIGILDSFGLGATEDAGAFGDAGANTFGHIVQACAEGRAGGRHGPLSIPNLLGLGLGHAACQAANQRLPLELPAQPSGLFGFAAEQSRGKDTPSGHWEMMGLPVTFDWGYFPKGPPSFPDALLDALIQRCGLPGVLGNKHASGTDIIDELGAEHIRTGKPIVYTSADSVFQIAAHESHFGLERLHALCRVARGLVDDYQIGRVIARPFIGEQPGAFVRTGNRKDYATPPHAPTLLDVAAGQGRTVIGIGKIGDIFAYSGVSKSVKAHGNDAIFDAWLDQTRKAPDGSIVFANFVDFDMLYGHRRDIAGYAAALEAFDRRLPQLDDVLRAGDLVVLSADHGCDPSWPGSDHTREFVPVLAYGPDVAAGDIGRRDSFADIGQSLAAHLGLPSLAAGTSFL